MSVNKANMKLFHFESLDKSHPNYDKNRRRIIIDAVERNNNSALVIVHPGYCREVIKNRIKYTYWPPIIYNTIKENVGDHQAYFKKLTNLTASTEIPMFIFCEQHKVEILERWVKSLSTKAPAVLVETYNFSPRPLQGWAHFIETTQKLDIKHFSTIGEMMLRVNNEDEGCVPAFYNNLCAHFKVDLYSEYTFPNRSFEILTYEIQRGDNIGAKLNPVTSRYDFLDD